VDATATGRLDTASSEEKISNTESKFVSSNNSRTRDVGFMSFKLTSVARAHPPQEQQHPHSATIDGINSREIKYHSSPVRLRQHSLPQNVSLITGHDAPHAAQHCHIFRMLDSHVQHGRVPLTGSRNLSH
jgi:hypothetical protein